MPRYQMCGDANWESDDLTELVEAFEQLKVFEGLPDTPNLLLWVSDNHVSWSTNVIRYDSSVQPTWFCHEEPCPLLQDWVKAIASGKRPNLDWSQLNQ